MKMENDSVTVVIPCRNRAGFLKETLRNLMGQLELGDEVLVVDNDSNDKLRETLEPYGDAVQTIHVPYKGSWMRGTALNRGIEEAVNPLIIVLDADTVPQPGCIKKLREAGGKGIYVSGLVLIKVPDTAKLPKFGGMRMGVVLMGTSPPEKVLDNVREGRVQEVMGACICFHQDDWRRVGGYTEAYDGHWGLAETDLYLKMHYAGVKLVALDKFNPVTLDGCVAVHIDNITHTKLRVTKQRLKDKELNRQLLLSLIPRYEKGDFTVG